MALQVPVSWGELLDKITILQIKSERIATPEKLTNIRHELQLLVAVRNESVVESMALQKLELRLRAVNEALWDIEDDIRRCEKAQDFGERFIDLARAVYRSNDQRAAIKYEINSLLGSEVVEEKSYESYD